MDHQCKAAFPRITPTILTVHTDEVWNIEWSHDGAHLASASKDKSAIMWRIGVSLCPSLQRFQTISDSRTLLSLKQNHQYVNVPRN